MRLALVLSLILITQSSLAESVSAVNNNRKGVKKLEKDQPYNAQKDFLEALEDDSFNPQLHLNLGLAFEMNKEPEKALKEYQLALKYAKDSDTRFYANFNIAQVIGEENVDLALSHYQAALDERPDSIETKHNIELLTMQKQGKGKGNKKDDKDNSDSDEDEQDPNAPRTNEPQNKPKPFDSKEMKEEDVSRILQELKNQEQAIRAKQQRQGKEMPLEKDW